MRFQPPETFSVIRHAGSLDCTQSLEIFILGQTDWLRGPRIRNDGRTRNRADGQRIRSKERLGPSPASSHPPFSPVEDLLDGDDAMVFQIARFGRLPVCQAFA